MAAPPKRPLAHERVRYVGEPVVAIVAATRQAARAGVAHVEAGGARRVREGEGHEQGQERSGTHEPLSCHRARRSGRAGRPMGGRGMVALLSAG